MPYEWVTPDQNADAPEFELHLWPYRSLPRKDFVTFIGLTAALSLIPMVAAIGSPVLWGLLPFVLLMLSGIYWGLIRSYSDGEILEELRIWPDRIRLDRHEKKSKHLHWEENPYWVQLKLRNDGPVENYLTLKGSEREVELGAFLDEAERKQLHSELQECLMNLR